MRPSRWRPAPPPPRLRTTFLQILIRKILSDAVERAAELLGCLLSPQERLGRLEILIRGWIAALWRTILSHCSRRWESGSVQWRRRRKRNVKNKYFFLVPNWKQDMIPFINIAFFVVCHLILITVKINGV